MGALLLGACGERDPDQIRAQQGLPPADFVPDVVSGEQLFNANCARCHGAGAQGTDQGPPLVHRVYEPSHHSDMAFYRAVQQGVTAHHWQFGNMPAIGDVSPSEAGHIVAYVRQLQRQAGIR